MESREHKKSVVSSTTKMKKEPFSRKLMAMFFTSVIEREESDEE